MQREFKISLSQEFYSDIVYLSQYDSDYPVIFTVTDKYSKASGINGYTAKFTGTRGDGTGLGFTYTATAIGHTVSFTIDTMLTGVAGTHAGEIIFYDQNGLYFGTANVQIIVEPAARPDGTIDADEEELRDLAQQCQDIVDTAAAEVKGEAEAWAVGERDGEPVSSTDPTYHNNAKYYSEVAQDIADSIGIDATLSISGKAADAKKTGDEIAALKEDLNAVDAKVGYKLLQLEKILTVTGKYIRPSDGHEVSTQNYRASTYLPVKGGCVINTGLKGTGTVAVLSFFTTPNYDGFSDFVVGDGTNVIKDISFTAPSDGYIRVCSNITNGSPGYIYFDGVIPDWATIRFNSIDAEISFIETGMSASEISTSYVPGYLSAGGEIVSPSASAEVTSDKIFGLSQIDISLDFAESHSLWIAVCAFTESGALVGSRSTYTAADTSISVTHSVPNEAAYVRYSYRTFDVEHTVTLSGIYSMKAISDGQNLNRANISANAQGIVDLSAYAMNVGRFKPCYDHLFVSKYNASIVIPHESLFHVRLSKKLGFDVIEANVFPTSDGVYIVNHLGSGGVFGGYFHHVDGVTDISNIAVASVTWDWVVENVRYNSTVEKYRVRPVRLEEFLAECRQQNLVPLITLQNQELLSIVEAYMGHNNYIAYKSTRALAPTAMHFAWVTLTTKADIIDFCNTKGKPFIYGMSNPTNFTDEELKDIISDLHKNGYYIGTSYEDENWCKYSALGFDFNGTQSLVNRIPCGNLYNIESIFGFSGFTHSGATETNGVLVYSEDGTLSPNVESQTYQVSMFDIELWFNGTITLNSIGEQKSTSFTSDGSEPIFVCSPVLNGTPVPTFAISAGTTVYDVKYRASTV